MYWYDNGYGMTAWGWVAMTVGIVVVLGLLLLAGVLLARATRRPVQPPPGPPARPAQEVLAERFAQGEIDEEEYRHRLSVLTGTTAGTR